MAVSNNPMTGLLELRALRNRKSFARLCLAMTLFSGLFAMCGMLSACFVQLTLTLLLVPFFLARSNSSFLLGLRRGGCLDEVLTTSTPATALVDGVVIYTLKELAASGLLFLGLLEGVGLFLRGYPGFELLAVLWPALLVASVVAWSYFLQLLPAWSEAGEWTLPLEAAPPALAVAAAVYVSIIKALESCQLGAYWEAGARLTLGLAASAFLARTLGLLGLTWGTRIRDCVRPALAGLREASRRNSRGLYQGLARDPVSWRELSRNRAVPEIFHRHWAGLLAAGIILFHLPPGDAICLVPPIFLMSTIWAGASALDILSREREHRTLEATLQTGMTAEQFLGGVIWAASLPRIVENLCLMLLGSIMAISAGSPPDSFTFACLCLVAAGCAVALTLAPWGGAIAGCYAAAHANTRRESMAQLVGVLLCWAVMALACAFACTWVGFAAWELSGWHLSVGYQDCMIAAVFVAAYIVWFWTLFVAVPRANRGAARRELEKRWLFSREIRRSPSNS